MARSDPSAETESEPTQLSWGSILVGRPVARSQIRTVRSVAAGDERLAVGEECEGHHVAQVGFGSGQAVLARRQVPEVKGLPVSGGRERPSIG